MGHFIILTTNYVLQLVALEPAVAAMSGLNSMQLKIQSLFQATVYQFDQMMNQQTSEFK